MPSTLHFNTVMVWSAATGAVWSCVEVQRSAACREQHMITCFCNRTNNTQAKQSKGSITLSAHFRPGCSCQWWTAARSGKLPRFMHHCLFNETPWWWQAFISGTFTVTTFFYFLRFPSLFFIIKSFSNISKFLIQSATYMDFLISDYFPNFTANQTTNITSASAQLWD